MKKGLCLVTILFCLFLFPSALAQAQQYHLKLLAVQEEGKGYQGSDADLYLELKEGSGRVFLETFPLTKLDTQISTRFAKEIACSHFKLPCDEYDFIYTIKAKSTIIGGPSAGAALAALTAIAVLDLPYDQQVTITGTINSGGVVGPVGGVKEKLEAASKAGLKKVLIPLGTANQSLAERELGSHKSSNSSNASLVSNNSNLLQYGKEKLSLEVMEVVDLDMVVKEITGVDLDHKAVTVTEDENYAQIMKGLQEALCARSDELLALIAQDGFVLDNESSATFRARNESAYNASLAHDYYSAASYCFSNDILLRTFYYNKQNLSRVELLQLYALIEKKAANLESKVHNESIETISDLQTAMVVEERLQDVKDQFERIRSQEVPLDLREMRAILAYAEERFYSAVAWFQFFSMNGKKFVLDTASLARSCQEKIMESEERYQYAAFFLGPQVQFIEDRIARAREALEKKAFTLCLITAAQAKANANAIVSSLGVDESALPQLLESKRKTVERVIFENSEDGVFPILGYSYYQYAVSLQEKDTFNALLYMENALEMSDLSMYFPEKRNVFERMRVSFFGTRDFKLQLEGFVTGVVVVLVVLVLLSKRKKRSILS
ncbi:hypothetical protein HYT55_00185 [Candidatus Woesearchaeota archaeon]|nr:hypothetical protein [Candidatus Woesearchaeota archaeon]